MPMLRSLEAPSQVRIVFEEAALIFSLPREATLGDLAARIAALEDEDLGDPVSIAVTLPH